MAEGTLLEWLVGPGDRVRRGDIVAVVDTDKAAMDVECFEDGVVERLLVMPGTVVPVGDPLAVLAVPGAVDVKSVPATAPAPVAAPAPVTAPAPAAHPAAPAPVATRMSPPVRRLAQRLGVDPGQVVGTGQRGRVTRADVEAAVRPPAMPAQPERRRPPGSAGRPASRPKVTPMARRLAVDLGVDPATLQGSGRHGAVVAADVRLAAAAAAPQVPAVRSASAGEGQDAASRGASMRRAIGALMARSKRELPHYYLSTTIDLHAVTALLAARNADLPVSGRLVPAAFLLKAAALAARKVPQLNGSWVDDAFVPAERVNLGVAVSLRTGGLVAPAILDADRLDVDALMSALRDVVGRARSGRLRRAEMTEGTLTVTNLGDRGVEAVFGVIYPPQVGLVGLGRVVERPVAVNGLIGVRPVVTATLSADHRATDGHIGSLYLAAMDSLLQRPENL
jgi:pyruvate dehydrogenase E2 component (dihydrolipoamide acetyltransferase)